MIDTTFKIHVCTDSEEEGQEILTTRLIKNKEDNIMTWEYRIVRYHSDYDVALCMMEVYYDDSNKIVAYCDANVAGCDENDVAYCLRLMSSALDKPIIDEKDLPKSNNLLGEGE